MRNAGIARMSAADQDACPSRDRAIVREEHVLDELQVGVVGARPTE